LDQGAAGDRQSRDLPKGDNPRFIVTNLLKDGWADPIQLAK